MNPYIKISALITLLDVLKRRNALLKSKNFENFLVSFRSTSTTHSKGSLGVALTFRLITKLQKQVFVFFCSGLPVFFVRERSQFYSILFSATIFRLLKKPQRLRFYIFGTVRFLQVQSKTMFMIKVNLVFRNIPNRVFSRACAIENQMKSKNFQSPIEETLISARVADTFDDSAMVVSAVTFNIDSLLPATSYILQVKLKGSSAPGEQATVVGMRNAATIESYPVHPEFSIRVFDMDRVVFIWVNGKYTKTKNLELQ